MAPKMSTLGAPALVLLGAVAAALAPSAGAAAPATVYEATEMSPENMDYDAKNKMFKAHSGWLNDRLVHYYKFRMYTPMTYPDNVKMGAAPVIPVAPLYLVTTDGTLGGVVAAQQPILRHHHADGEKYSDFVEVVLVTAPPGYVANTWKSWADVQAAAAPMTATGALINAPLVPTGSMLERPGGGVAPIKPLKAWYKGDEVQLFLFETTSRQVADWFNPRTREGAAAQDGSGFEMVVSAFGRPDKVSFIPIWHFNQFGAVTGEGGGPDATGQRNVIGLDRKDPGYSPLWQVFWLTQVPPGYGPSQASHPDQITEQNGFKLMVTPMFVNCPNIGVHGGGAMNALKAASFSPRADVSRDGAATLQGALVMEGGKTVTARVGDKTVGTATTGMMGGYRIPLEAAALPAGESTVQVQDAAGNVVATFPVKKAEATPGQPPAGQSRTPGAPLAALAAAVVVVAVAARRR